MLETPKLLTKMVKYIKKTDYPKKKLVSKASRCLWSMNNYTANDYFFSYNGGMFLQKN
jgi:hypothetical protein